MDVLGRPLEAQPVTALGEVVVERRVVWEVYVPLERVGKLKSGSPGLTSVYDIWDNFFGAGRKRWEASLYPWLGSLTASMGWWQQKTAVVFRGLDGSRVGAG